ncbi:MAG TPA: hypothetical protein VGB08_09160 [Allosphingosinicella sp.]
MRTPAPLFALLAAALAVPAQAQEGGWTSERALARVREEAWRACRAFLFGDVARQGEALAGLRPGCRPRPALALRIAQALAARPGHEAAEGYRLLAALQGRGIGIALDEAAAREHMRRAWMLRPSVAATQPFGNAGEANAWLARTDSIAFLRRHGEGSATPLLRARLARALLVRGSPADTAEALAILSDAALILRLRDAARRDLDEEAPREDLAFFARRRLEAAATDEERREAIAWLADAAFAPDSPYRDGFFRAVAAANGGAPPATIPGEQPAISEQLRAHFLAFDYPPSAIRSEEQGRVALRGLVDPGGRLIFTEPVSPGQPPRLVAGMRRQIAQRSLPRLELGAARSGAYVWIELPTLGFSLVE